MKRRKDGRYVYTVTIDGKQKFYYGKTPKEAIKKSEQKPSVSSPLFADVAEKWREEHISEISYKTWTSYNSQYSALKTAFADMEINDITPQNITAELKNGSAEVFTEND